MSAAIASRRRPSRMASAMYGSSSTINTRMLSMFPAGAYRLAHIAGVSKDRYVLATPRRLVLRHGGVLVRTVVLWLPGLEAWPPAGHRLAVVIVLGAELLAERRLLVAVDESNHGRGHHQRVEQQALLR